MLDFSNASLDMKCPKCETNIAFTLGQVRRGEKISCPGCDVNVVITNREEVDKAENSVNDSLVNLKRSIKDINIKLRL